jgi:hypothetical protein
MPQPAKAAPLIDVNNPDVVIRLGLAALFTTAAILNARGTQTLVEIAQAGLQCADQLIGDIKPKQPP